MIVDGYTLTGVDEVRDAGVGRDEHDDVVDRDRKW